MDCATFYDNSFTGSNTSIEFVPTIADAYTDSGALSQLETSPGLSVANGNLVIMAARWYQSASQTITAVTDSASNTFTALPARCDSQSTITCVQLWYAYNVVPALSDVVTIQFSSGTTYAYVAVHQYSGVLATSNPIDVSAAGGAGTGSTLTSNSFSANYGKELVFCAGSTTAGSAYTEGTGFTLRDGQDGFGPYGALQSEDMITASTYSGTAALSRDSSSAWVLQCASFFDVSYSQSNTLTESDFSLDGAFQVGRLITIDAPTTQEGGRTGLTVRYIDDVRYFVMLLPNGNVIEFPDPGVGSTSSAYPQVSASNVTTYSGPFGYVPDATGDCGVAPDQESCSMRGLFWDEQGQRLYGSYGDAYGPSSQSNMPSLGAVTLNHTAHTSSVVGFWTVGTGGYKSSQTGVARLPDAWANAHTSGKTLIAGWGGPFSIQSSGGVSMGIAAQAFEPPTGSSGTITTQTLVGYPWAACSSSPPRMNRPALTPALDQYYDDCGNAVVTWPDSFTGCAFVDTGSKAGLVCIAELAKGYTAYAFSTRTGVGAQHQWFVFDPDQLAAGPASSVQPWTNFERQFPDESYSGFPYTVTPMSVTSATRSGNVLTYGVPSHGLPLGINISMKFDGVSAAEYNGMFSGYATDAETFKACASGSGELGSCGSGSQPSSASTDSATATRAWKDNVGVVHQLALTYDALTQDIFVMIASAVNHPGEPTMTIYKYHVN